MEKVELKDLDYLRRCNMWYPKDMQKALDYLSTNKDECERFLNEIDALYTKYVDYCGDCSALKDVIKSGYVSTFKKYDSAVRENFVDMFDYVIFKNKHY